MNILISFLILTFCTLPTMAFADTVIIVNPKNLSHWNEENIKTEIRSIFLGTKQKFSNGESVKPLDQPEGKEIRKDFYLKIAGKDETGMNIHWSNLIFTGRGSPPAVIGDDILVKKYVSENINSIGYINSNSLDKTVKAIYSFK